MRWDEGFARALRGFEWLVGGMACTSSLQGLNLWLAFVWLSEKPL